MSSSLGNDKILFGMLYINLLYLVWFWSKIWGFYKFWSFKSLSFWYLRLNRLILILHLKCFLFRFMWFFVLLLKVIFWMLNYVFGLISINFFFRMLIYTKSPTLGGCPQRQGTCTRVYVWLVQRMDWGQPNTS